MGGRMADANAVTIAGGLGKDPELRYATNGKAFTKFSLANGRSKKQGDKWVDETYWFDVVTFGQLAENVAESLRKGSKVVVTGKLSQRSWETDDGQKRSTVELVADDVSVSLRVATAVVTRNERKERVGAGSSPF